MVLGNSGKTNTNWQVMLGMKEKNWCLYYSPQNFSNIKVVIIIRTGAGKVIKVIKVILHHNYYYNHTILIEMSLHITIMKLQNSFTDTKFVKLWHFLDKRSGKSRLSQNRKISILRRRKVLIFSTREWWPPAKSQIGQRAKPRL